MTKRFMDILKEKKPPVWERVNSYLPTEVEPAYSGDGVVNYSEETSLHWDMVSEYPRRQGKYIRPALILLTAEALGVPEEDAVQTAAAMQTFQDWVLIHDDWQDDSEERRGEPTLHRIYSPELAVNAGDALHVIMWKILRDNNEVIGSDKCCAIQDEFYRLMTRTIVGQTLEIKWAQENKMDLKDEDVFTIMDGKTVYYTIAGPMRLGAILGDATDEQLESIFKFATPLGRCFQIRDDILDLTSDFEGEKDQFANDIYEGKRTIMLAHLLRNATPEENIRLEKILEKTRQEKTRNEVEWVLDKMKEHGSIDYGTRLAEDYAKQAEAALDEHLSWIPEGEQREALQTAVDFILTRGK